MFFFAHVRVLEILKEMLAEFARQVVCLKIVLEEEGEASPVDALQSRWEERLTDRDEGEEEERGKESVWGSGKERNRVQREVRRGPEGHVELKTHHYKLIHVLDSKSRSSQAWQQLH